jgi:hypothetical protein
VALHILANVLVKGGHFEATIKDSEVYDEWSTFPLNDILADNLICSGVVYTSIVNAWWQLASLHLIISELTRHQINGEVLLQLLNLKVFCQVIEERFRSNGYLSVYEIASDFILARLLFETDVLAVDLIGGLMFVVLPVIKDLVCFCIDHQGKVLAGVSDWAAEGDRGENFGQDGLVLFVRFLLVVHAKGTAQVSVANDIALQHEEVVSQLD